MNVLSLFDGVSCGQQALDRTGIKIDNYYASEIEKQPIIATKHNYPHTTEVGDVIFLRYMITWKPSVMEKFFNSTYISPKKKEHGKYLYSIKDKILNVDMVIAGSPCQGFSRAGKGLNFSDLRSKLFFEFVTILEAIKKVNPKVFFLLENVDMEKWCLGIISKYLGIFPVKINSSLVSAQNRERWYWTNIRTRQEGFFGETHTDIPQPKDLGIVLKDILQPESEVAEKYYLSEKMMAYLTNRKGNFNNGKINYKYGEEKAACINKSSGALDISDNIIVQKISKDGRLKGNQEKASTVCGGAHSGGNHSDMDLLVVEQKCHMMTNQGKTIGKETEKSHSLLARDYKGFPNQEHTGVVVSVNPCEEKNDGVIVTKNYIQWDTSGKGYKSQQDRAFFTDGKCGTLVGGSKKSGNIAKNVIIEGERGCLKFGRTEEAKKIRKKNMAKGKDTTPFSDKEIRGIDYEKMNTLTCAHSNDNLLFVSEELEIKVQQEEAENEFPKIRIRRLTPIEVCRLQTMVDNYFYTETWKNLISDSAIYKAVGNGWTVDVIAHIFSFLPKEFFRVAT